MTEKQGFLVDEKQLKEATEKANQEQEFAPNFEWKEDGQKEVFKADWKSGIKEVPQGDDTLYVIEAMTKDGKTHSLWLPSVLRRKLTEMENIQNEDLLCIVFKGKQTCKNNKSRSFNDFGVSKL